MGFWSLLLPSWSPARARRFVVAQADRHARDDFGRDASAARRMTDDEVGALAEEGFWNVVFPILEDRGVDPAAEVDGKSIEQHYVAALLEAYRRRR